MENIHKSFYTVTWNPLDGCLLNCRYCRSRATAERLGGHRSLASYMAQDSPIDTRELRILEFSMRDELTGQAEAYPFSFSPTYHRHRLLKLPSDEKSENILVCGTGDLFGDWVMDWIVEEVFSYAGKAGRHNYLFMTKNPARYDTLTAKQDNMLFGATVDSQERADAIIDAKVRSLDYLCIEPILSGIDLNGFLQRTRSRIQWVIVGAESGNTSGKVIPKREWVTGIAEACAAQGIPLFMRPGQADRSGRHQLEKLMGASFRQEFPPILQENIHT